MHICTLFLSWNCKFSQLNSHHFHASFIKKKHVFSAFIAWWKLRRIFGRIWEQISGNLRIQNRKHVFCAFIAWWKPRWMFGRIWEQISENPRILTNFAEVLTGYGGMDNMFYLLILLKLLFSMLAKRKTIYEALTVNSHKSETVKPQCSHFRAS